MWKLTIKIWDENYVHTQFDWKFHRQLSLPHAAVQPHWLRPRTTSNSCVSVCAIWKLFARNPTILNRCFFGIAIAYAVRYVNDEISGIPSRRQRCSTEVSFLHRSSCRFANISRIDSIRWSREMLNNLIWENVANSHKLQSVWAGVGNVGISCIIDKFHGKLIESKSEWKWTVRFDRLWFCASFNETLDHHNHKNSCLSFEHSVDKLLCIVLMHPSWWWQIYSMKITLQ